MEPQYAPSTASMDNRKKSVILTVIGAIFLIFGYGGFQIFKNLFGKGRGAIAVANKFLMLQQAHDFRGAHDLFTPANQTAITTENLAKIESSIEHSQGKIVHYGVPAVEYTVNLGGSFVQLTYPLTSTNNNSSVTLIVIQAQDGWEMYGYSYTH